MKWLGIGFAILTVCCAMPQRAVAQPYPARPVTIIVPFPAGGVPDTVPRAIAELLQQQTGQPFIVDHKPGATQTIGMRAWRLRVVAADGNRVSWSRAILRFFIALVSLAALGAGFWWALVDAQRRTWHDMAACTHMVRLSKT